MKKSQVQAQEPVESAPGAFLNDGRFKEDGQIKDQGEVDRFVRALVNQRRQGRLSPEQAGSAIEAAEFMHAFPCWRQWRDAKMDNGEPLWWSAAQTATSVEEFLKREGRGVEGHWCGERWVSGTEKDCQDQRHHVLPSKDQVDRYVAAIVAKLSDAPASQAPALKQQVPRLPASDETWSGWLKLGYDASPEAAEKAAKLRSLGLHPGLAKDDAVAHAERQP